MYKNVDLKNGIPNSFHDELEGGRDEFVHIVYSWFEGVPVFETAGQSRCVELGYANAVLVVEDFPFFTGLHLELVHFALRVNLAVVRDEPPEWDEEAVLDCQGGPNEQGQKKVAGTHLQEKKKTYNLIQIDSSSKSVVVNFNTLREASSYQTRNFIARI